MPQFSSSSMLQLHTCDERIIDLFDRVIVTYDCTIICGHRNEQKQNNAYNDKKSKVQWPNSPHNNTPSTGIDVAPYINGGIPWPKTPYDWNDTGERNKYIKDMGQFYMFVGYVLGVAENMNIPIRSGADWDMDHDLRDNKFDDLVHFELIQEKEI